MRQLVLFTSEATDGLARWLSSRMGRPVGVVLTQNRSTMLSWRERRGALELRLHRMFLKAGPNELDALASYLAGDAACSGGVLDAFIAEQARSHRARPTRPMRTCGRFHDLAAIYGELNATYFHGACAAQISWSRAGGRRYRRSIRLGSYVGAEQCIYIHPALDQAFVPRYYVAWVVFHEMLHEVLGAERRARRRKVHPPEFAVLEQSYPDYPLCRAWETANLHRLLRFGRQRDGSA